MIGARARAAAVLVTLLVAVAILIVPARRHERSASPSPGKRPTLLLLTSLPLFFGEDFSLAHAGSPALKALETHYHVLPINLADPADLAKAKLLLMAQPLAQAPQDLVAVDSWVRRGGRLVLLADPMLEWPSKLPLADPARPPPMFVDTGLLAHWGLRLDTPDERGPAERALGRYKIFTLSPGALFGNCPISTDRLVARCRIGSGEAIVIADADFLNVAGLGPRASRNLEGLLNELASTDSS
ncbi:MAG TPA: hypothetical protein VJ846_13575 [Sphingomicrobium sp.]|nr:hypothetical protein [Sphingomicrobium sp.]